MSERRIIFNGELQLIRWGESSTAGATITFYVHPDDLESFKLLKARVGKSAGQRIGAAMVLINEDETVVEHEEPAYPKPRPGALAMLAVRWCQDPVFHDWLYEACQVGRPAQRSQSSDEAWAKSIVLDWCGLIAKHGAAASRKHLDTDEDAAQLFQQCIRGPYMKYLIARGVIQ